jgi:hypothetical protein
VNNKDTTKPSFPELATKIGNLVQEKNKAYGSSYEKGGEFLKVLYPNGVSPEQYGDMLGIVRIFDKLMRIATSYQGTEEKKVDAYSDIIGYGLLGLRKALSSSEEEKEEQHLPPSSPPSPPLNNNSNNERVIEENGTLMKGCPPGSSWKKMPYKRTW